MNGIVKVEDEKRPPLMHCIIEGLFSYTLHFLNPCRKPVTHPSFYIAELYIIQTGTM